MADKLESLITRLEAAVSRLENNQEGQVKIESSKEISSNPSSKASNPEAFTAFNSLYKDWEEKAKATGNQDIIELSNLGLHAFYWTDAIISLANTSKKPSNDTFANISKYIREKAKEIDDKFIRPRKCENHAKAVKEGLGVCFWFLTDAPPSYIDGVIEPTVFHANRVKSLKVQAETEWIDKFTAILKGYKDYTKEHFITGLIWKGKTEADFSQLLEGKLPTSGSEESKSAQVDAGQNQSKTSFLSEINKGASITEGLVYI
jgi:hypothetical protein